MGKNKINLTSVDHKKAFRMVQIVFFALMCVCAVTGFSDSITVREKFVFLELGQPYLVDEEITLHQPYNIEQVQQELQQAKDQQVALTKTCSEINLGSDLKTVSDENMEIKEILKLYYPYTNNPKYANDTNEYGLVDARRICDEKGFTLVQPRNQTELYAVARLTQAFGIEKAILNTVFDPHRSVNRMMDYSDVVMVPSVLYPHTPTVETGGANIDHLADDRNAVYLIYSNGTLSGQKEYYEGPYDSGWISKARYRSPTIEWKAFMEARVRGGVICQLKHKQRYQDLKQQLEQQQEQAKKVRQQCEQLAKSMQEKNVYLSDQLEQTIVKYGLEYNSSDQKQKRGWGLLLGMPKMLKLSSKVIRSGKTAYKGYKVMKMGQKAGKGVTTLGRVAEGVGTVAKVGAVVGTLGQAIKVGKALYAPLKPLTAGMKNEVLTQSPIQAGTINQIVESVQRFGQDSDTKALITSVLAAFQQTTQLIHAGIEELDDTLQSLSHNQIPGKFLNGIKEFFSKSDDGQTATQLKEKDPIVVEPEIEKGKTIHVMMTFQQGQEKWRLIRIIPLPTYADGLQETVISTTAYALIDTEGSKFIPLTSEQALECQNEICQHISPILSIRDDPCTMKHYREDIDITAECRIEVKPARPMFQSTEIGIIYAVPNRTRTKIICPEGIEERSERDLEGKGLLKLPPGCEMVILNPYRKISGPMIHTFESLEESYNNTRWSEQLSQQRGIHYNLTKVTQQEFNQAKEELDQDVYITTLVLSLTLFALLVLLCATCVGIRHHNNRIDRRKEVDYRQENLFVELRTDFDRFSQKIGRLVKALEEKEIMNKEDGLSLYVHGESGSSSGCEESGYVDLKAAGQGGSRFMGRKAWYRIRDVGRHKGKERKASESKGNVGEQRTHATNRTKKRKSNVAWLPTPEIVQPL